MSTELLAPVFAQHLNTTFRAQLDETRSIDFELVEVENRNPLDGYECFSLTFRAPLGTPIAQGSYSLNHDKMGVVEIFLVPISQEPDGITFEAVFNRSITEANEVPVS